MTAETRQRSAAQRGGEKDGKAPEDVKIQDEQGEAVWTQPEYSLWPEQEEEIKKIREQNAKNEREAQNGMDMGLMVVALMTAYKFYRYQTYLGASLPTILVFTQLVLLPLSVTPRRLGPLGPLLKARHPFVPVAQLLVVLFQAVLITAKETWGVYDLAQISLPFVVSIAVEVQRRSERDLARQMASWEKSKYANKGA